MEIFLFLITCLNLVNSSDERKIWNRSLRTKIFRKARIFFLNFHEDHALAWELNYEYLNHEPKKGCKGENPFKDLTTHVWPMYAFDDCANDPYNYVKTLMAIRAHNREEVRLWLKNINNVLYLKMIQNIIYNIRILFHFRLSQW